jgi:large subunit ribosomal protein L13
MDSRSFKTISARKETAVGKWYVIDAEGQILGRLCTRVASVLRGKHRPDYTPHVDCGDKVIIINADKIRVTGNKENAKEYTRYTGYPGGLRITAFKNMLAKTPERVLEIGVRGMLPKNKLGRDLFRKLHVYAGSTHPHAAQQPEVLNV